MIRMSTRDRPKEGPLERLARQIVAEELGVAVDRHDDGTAPSQVDAIVRYPQGPVPLEVVADQDAHYEQQWAELKRRGPLLRTELSRSWAVFLNNRGRVRELRALLPRALATWPGLTSPGDDSVPAELRRLGVVDVVEIDSREPGAVVLTHEGWNSWDDPIELNEWVVRVLQREADVVAKLNMHGGDQRHAFIWARPSSAWNVNSLLTDDDEDVSLPVHGPTLPAGLTHVWVASTMTRRGCLVLENDRWRRTGRITPSGHELEDS